MWCFWGSQYPILMKLGVWYWVTNRIIHTKFQRSGPLFVVSDPIGVSISHNKFHQNKSKNSSSCCYDPQKRVMLQLTFKNVPDLWNLVWIILLVTQYHTPSFIRIGYWEPQKHHIFGILSELWPSPLGWMLIQSRHRHSYIVPWYKPWGIL